MDHAEGNARRQLDELFRLAMLEPQPEPDERRQATDERRQAPTERRQATSLMEMHDSNVHGNVSVAERMTVHMHSQVSQITTQRFVEKTIAEVKPGVEHITDEQASALHALVKTVAETERRLKKAPRSVQAIWAALNAHCRVPQYRLIRIEDFGKAQKFLHQWRGRLDSMASAPVKDGDAWRKRKYAYIKINSKISPEIVDRYIAKHFGDIRLTDLDNQQLEQVYRYVASRKPRQVLSL